MLNATREGRHKDEFLDVALDEEEAVHRLEKYLRPNRVDLEALEHLGSVSIEHRAIRRRGDAYVEFEFVSRWLPDDRKERRHTSVGNDNVKATRCFLDKLGRCLVISDVARRQLDDVEPVLVLGLLNQGAELAGLGRVAGTGEDDRDRTQEQSFVEA